MSKNYYRKITHATYDCRYHIVFVPKYRYTVLADEKIQNFVKTVFEQVCANNDILIIEGKIRSNHVHLYLSIPPLYSVSQVVKWLKEKSATRCFRQFPHLLKQYWGRHFWARGYFVSTVGLTDDIIKAYIHNQEQKEEQEQAQLKQMQLWK